MAVYSLSANAAADLDEIYEYTILQFGRTIAVEANLLDNGSSVQQGDAP